MGTPNAVTHITDSTFVSNLDLHKPEILNKMFLSKGTQGIGYLLTRSLGFETPVAADDYSHFEKDESHDSIKINAGVGPGAPGVSVNFVLDADSLDADNNYYPRLYDWVLFPNEVVGWIRSITVVAGGLGLGVDEVTLEIRPNDILDAIPAVLADAYLPIVSSSFSEASGMPLPAITSAWKYTNTAQIIKEAIGATGTELVNQTWIDLYNEAGEFQGYYRTGQADLDYRMLTKIDGMFWFGKKIDNTAGRALDAVSGYPIKGSEGLFPAIRRLGHVNGYVPGAFAVGKFDEYDRILTQEYIPSDIPIWMPMGLYLYQEIENELVTYFANTNIQFAKQTVNDKLFKSNESLAASVNFKYLTKSDRTWLFNKMNGWSNPKTYGITGYDVEYQGLCIPLDKKKDPKSSEDIPSIGTRYRAMGRYNRRSITDTLSGIGAAGGRIPVDTIDRTNTYQLAHMGNHFMGLNRFILIDP
jgi:hypothetical protein